MDLFFGTTNPGKLRELRRLVAGLPIRVVSPEDLGRPLPEVVEDGRTFAENAAKKAAAFARLAGMHALADDSGLCVDALQGAPGLYSARYAGGHGDSAANNAKLLRTLDGRPDAERRAFFICVLVLLRHAEDPAPLVAEGRWHGRVLHAPRGEGGFGYDPLFLPDGHERSAAELDKALKNRISHRGQALAQLRARLGDLAA
jgi:XTP/dITP diphosphohydrolase